MGTAITMIKEELKPSVTDGIVESTEQGFTILADSNLRPYRRVLYVNSYGGVNEWRRVKNGLLPSHHLWGCLQLLRKGYEVALAEPLSDFYFRHNPLPHDLRLFRFAQAWLGKDGIVYCGHNVLYWLPLLRRLGAVKSKIVSLLFAREPLAHSSGHSGIIALTPAAERYARHLSPNGKIKHLGWGVDLDFFPHLPYLPLSFLACGRTERDHPTLHAASGMVKSKMRVICPELPAHLKWPANVTTVTGGRTDDTVTYEQLLNDHYATCTGSLVILKPDHREHTAVGFTNLIEAMAMARPVIVTKTGGLATELDVAAAKCGVAVPPSDPAKLAAAINFLADNPALAKTMGESGRKLAESHYNINRYTSELHAFFESF